MFCHNCIFIKLSVRFFLTFLAPLASVSTAPSHAAMS